VNTVELQLEVESIGSLVDALRWAGARTPPAAFVDSVAQDEFTHDVIIRVAEDVFLALDTS
jgi:hypothetical protein